jgi:hypothetical protein
MPVQSWQWRWRNKGNDAIVTTAKNACALTMVMTPL